MRIVFIGTGEIGVPTLRTLQSSEHKLVGIVTQQDKPVGREQKIIPPPIKAALAHATVPILQPGKIKDPQSIDEIRALAPDVIVVMAYGQILPRTILEIPKLACLNLHASLLPRWRGAAPIQAAIAAGDDKTGMTVMFMNEGLDTGDILLQRRIEIAPDETGRSLHDRLAQVAPNALLDALRLLESSTAPRAPQDNSIATHAPKLTREDGKIEWNESAHVIERKIRAFNPWPGTFAQLKTGKLKIFSGSVIPLTERPGRVYFIDDTVAITAGRDAIALGEVQLEGKRRMSAAEFARGHSLDLSS